MASPFPFITNVHKKDEDGKDVGENAKLETYEYKKHIPGSVKYKKKSTIFDTAYTVEDNISRALSIAISGFEKCGKNLRHDMRFGERTFFQSGTCGPKSRDGCANQKRYIIVNSIPSGKFEKQMDYRKGATDKMQPGPHSGLIPSLLEDLFAFSPEEVVKTFANKSDRVNDVCQKITFEERQLIPQKDAKTKVHSLCVPSNEAMRKPLQEEFVNQLPKPNQRQIIITLILLFSVIVSVIVAMSIVLLLKK